MKLTLLGGGGFRVPLVYRALLGDAAPGRVQEVHLYDTDVVRAQAIGKVLTHLSNGHVDAPTVTIHTDLDEALAGSDFIFSAIRVGGTRGRDLDEQIARRHGLIGQETTGFGGISYALRGLPVVMDIAERIAWACPNAWVINFTNPAGMITEAMSRVLGQRVIGICDSPVGLARRVLTALETTGAVPLGTSFGIGLGRSAVRIDYAGLNHLGWLRGIEVDGRNVLPLLLEDADLLESFEEGRLFKADWLRTLGAIPNEYLHYYYYQREAYAADTAATLARGGYLHQQQAAFYAAAADASPTASYDLWERTRLDREATYMATNRQAAGHFERDEDDIEAGGYDQVALTIMHAIAHDEPAELILNVANRRLFVELDDEAIVEVPCRVDATGVHPLPAEPLPDYARGLVTTVKYVERCTIEAGLTGDWHAAVRAVASHPLVDSVAVAVDALTDCIDTFDELAYLRRK